MTGIEKIISRGVAGPELAALSAARLCGVAVGGSTRIHNGRHCSGIVHRYGLHSDPCSRRQALLRNVRQADGTVVFGRFGKALELLLESERTHYCCIEALREDAGQRVVAWVRRHDIRTLNVLGRAGPDATYLARVVMLEVLTRLGARPRPPGCAPAGGRAVVAGEDAYYAIAPWPAPAAWRWRDSADRWERVVDWRSAYPLRGGTHRHAWVHAGIWRLVPAHVRPWITHANAAFEPGEDQVQYDLDLLEALGRLGKSAHDLARAGRWAILRLVCDRCCSTRDAGQGAAWDFATALLPRRQRDLVGAFGFPATESTVRILGKVLRTACDSQTLADLRTAMADPGARATLQALPCVSSTIVLVLANPWLREVVGRRLLRQLIVRRDDGTFTAPMDEISLLIFRLEAEAERAGHPPGIAPIHSARALERLVIELENWQNCHWPPPPPALPAIPGVIEPLTDGAALVAEGRAMQHCAKEYEPLVRRGHCLMYRILPDSVHAAGRATLQLMPAPGGLWQMAQLRAAANAPPDPGTVHLVETWLFFAQCDPAATAAELSRSCLLELGR